MSGTINKVIMIGRLGDDVKVRYFENGSAIGNFPLATNETYTNKKTGEKITNTDWHQIVVRNKLAENCEKYLTKGDKIYLEGRLKNRQWEKDGIKRYATEIHVTELSMLSNRKKDEKRKNSTENSQSTLSKETTDKVENDDLPF